MPKTDTTDCKISEMVKSEYSGRKEGKARVSEGIEGRQDELIDPYVVWRRRVYPLCKPTGLCVTLKWAIEKASLSLARKTALNRKAAAKKKLCAVSATEQSLYPDSKLTERASRSWTRGR
jgi:hypothetical protein